MFADIVRWFVIAEGAFLTGFAFAVMREAGKFRAPPRHIWMIAMSYMVICLGYTVEIAANIGDGFGGRSVVGFVAFTFGLVAMIEMYRTYQYVSRLKRHEKKAIQVANRLMRGESVPKKEMS